MIDLDNQTNLTLNIDALEEIASSLTTKEVELIIIDGENMKRLNSKYRSKEKSTDVLSFPMEAPFTEQSIFGMPLGSIVICQDYVITQANVLGHTIQDELSLLFIHGMLHLLGFDHEIDNGEMRQREEALIEQFGLPKSLIVRTGE